MTMLTFSICLFLSGFGFGASLMMFAWDIIDGSITPQPYIVLVGGLLSLLVALSLV